MVLDPEQVTDESIDMVQGTISKYPVPGQDHRHYLENCQEQ